MVLNYTCPSCGADMTYNIKLKKLYCAHCDHDEDFKQDDESYKNLAEEAVDKTRYCVNCGAVVALGKKTCATHCEYCGTSFVVADRLSREWYPSYVLPFELDRKDAEAAFKKWCRNGRFSPRGFMSADNIKRLQPLYIPYWLYDLDSNLEVNGTATKVRVWRVGETEYTETSFYDVYRKMRLEYVHVPHDASEKMDDTLMAKLEPYQFDKLKTFAMPYLAGFEADQGDYQSNDVLPLVKQQVEKYAADYARTTVSGYSTVNLTHQNMQYDKIKSDYMYLPLWFISYKYHDKEYIFAMNGQTGKVIGEPPISKGKVAAWFGGLSAVAFAILMVIGGLF